MGLISWIATRTPSIKLVIGVSLGILVYAGFRYLIYLANKYYKNNCDKKGNPLSEKNIRKFQEQQLRESGY